MGRKGEMTVFLALALTVMLSLIIMVIESARVNMIRFQIECAADMSLYSALAEYNRSMADRYGLFFIDTAYGKKEGSPANTENHIREYMNYNLKPDSGLEVLNNKDFLALNTEWVSIEECSRATDENCLVLKSQAVAYQKMTMGITLGEKIIKNADMVKKNKMLEGISEERHLVKEEIQSFQHRKVETATGEWEEIEIENPAEAVPIEDKSVVYLVTKNAGGVSGRQALHGESIGTRKLKTGNGCSPNREEAEGIADEIIFGEYLLQHCGYYTKETENSALLYQIEYLLNGSRQDAENLKAAVHQLLFIREVSNYLYLQTDTGRQAEADGAAALVSAVLFIPELKELIKQALLLAWAYTESVNDVKLLLEGGKLGLVKTGEEWHMGFMDMFHYRDCLGGRSNNEKGMSYEDYLRVLLLLENPVQKAERFGDIIEMDIKNTPENSEFQLDNCVDSMEVFLEVSSKYGYQYDIKRRYGYEMLE